MAKRKRLSPLVGGGTPFEGQRAPESKAMGGPLPRMTPPIADVAGASAAAAALDEIAQEMSQARTEGRLVLNLSLDQIDESYLVRDRLVLNDEDMDALCASLSARGQQTPIEVSDLGQGRYGLISGWRRLSALRCLLAEAGDQDRFGTVQCLVRRPDMAAGAYLAMVEENEIRAGLSFYERARIAARAAEQGAFPTARAAVKSLFASASRAKRSKINSFLQVYAALDPVLRFPAAIPERLGLALAQGLADRPDMAGRIGRKIRQGDPREAAAEQVILQQTLRPKSEPKKAKPSAETVIPGIELRKDKGRLVLSGQAVNAAFETDLRQWLASRTKR